MRSPTRDVRFGRRVVVRKSSITWPRRSEGGALGGVRTRPVQHRAYEREGRWRADRRSWRGSPSFRMRMIGGSMDRSWLAGILGMAMMIGCHSDGAAIPSADEGAVSVDGGASCSDAAGRSCREGAVFVDCGKGPGAVFCSSGQAGRCVWTSDGCPFGPYQLRIGPSCDCAGDCPPVGTLASLFYGYGTTPWSLTYPATSVAVSFDPAVNSGGLNSVACTRTRSASCAKPSICCENTTGPGAGPVLRTEARAFTDTFSIRVGIKGVFAGWSLLIEVDPDAETARACRVPFTDNVPQCGTVGEAHECSVSGTLALSAVPAAANYTSLKGEFDFRFTSGLQISGAF